MTGTVYNKALKENVGVGDLYVKDGNKSRRELKAIAFWRVSQHF